MRLCMCARVRMRVCAFVPCMRARGLTHSPFAVAFAAIAAPFRVQQRPLAPILLVGLGGGLGKLCSWVLEVVG